MLSRSKGINRSGMGLGLTISKMIIRELGGEIAVTSNPNEGSRFTVGIPLELPSVPVLDEEARSPSPPKILLTETGGNELETFDDFASVKYESIFQEQSYSRTFKNLPLSIPRVLPPSSAVFLESTRKVEPPIQIIDVKSQNLTKRILCVDDSPYNLFVL